MRLILLPHNICISMEQVVAALASTATGSQPVGKAIGMVADITLSLLPAPKWAAAIWAVVTYE
jgi:hypothetical protein